MQKIFTSILCLIFVFNIQAQNIKFTYNFDDFQVVDNDQYQMIVLPNSQQLAKPGDPCLPYVAVQLLLPPYETSKKIEFIYEDKVKIEGSFKLFPKQYVRPISLGNSGEFLLNEQTYKSTNYPKIKNSDVSTYFMNGYGFALASFTPFEYNPSSGELFLYKKVTAIVDYKKDKSFSIKNLSSRPQVIEKVKNFAQNKDLIKQYPAKKSNDEYELLIITTSSFTGSFNDLIELYLQRGIRTEIVALTDITSTMTGVDNAEKMRNYIIQQYQTHDIQYVMLAGDADILPYRGMYCSVQSSSVYEDNNIPADVYFSGLDGTWNTNNNSLWGEQGEDDLLPDVAVGRLPFSNSAELSNMINKIIQYTTNPVTSTGELSNPLLAGEHLYDNPQTWGADYLDLLIGFHNDNGYTTNGINTSYTTMYQRDGTWNVSNTSEIINAMNSGHSFLHHVGHANSTYMMGLYISHITNNNFSQLNGVNHNYALVYSHGCICGAFDQECISEEMVKIEKCAVAVFTNSRYGWFNEGQTEGPSQHLHREFVDAIYNDKQNHAGVAEMISKIETAPWVNNPVEWEPGAQRWCFYDHNVLTDPTLPIWTNNPFDISTVYDNEIPIGADLSIYVSSAKGPLQNYTCVLLQDGVMIGKSMTNELGITSIFVDPSIAQPGAAKLYVSGYNIITQEYNLTITEAGSAVLSVSSFWYEDGNNDVPDYNEELYLNIKIKNFGLENATNVVLTLTSDDDKIEVVHGIDNLGTVAALDSLSSENILQIKIDYVPDNYTTQLNLSIVSDQYSTNKIIPVTVNAPKLTIQNVSIQEISGNGNGVLEANETGNITFEYINEGHAVSPAINTILRSNNDQIEILDSLNSISSVNPNETFVVSSNFEIGPEIENGDLVNFISIVNANIYSSSCQIAIYFGNTTEDFETGDFSKFDWLFEGDAPWTITSQNVYQGTYSAKSGSIDNEKTSTLKIEIDVLQDGEISFFKKVSSEEDLDFLRFYIDGLKKGEWSGQVNWSNETYNISAGTHTLKWSYEKDWSYSGGDDCAWLDNIELPAMGNMIITSANEVQSLTSLKTYPNPFTSMVNFEFNSQKSENCLIYIYDLSGKTVFRDDFITIPGDNYYLWNSVDNNSGVYLYKIIVGNQMYIGKVIKE